MQNVTLNLARIEEMRGIPSGYTLDPRVGYMGPKTETDVFKYKDITFNQLDQAQQGVYSIAKQSPYAKELLEPGVTADLLDYTRRAGRGRTSNEIISEYWKTYGSQIRKHLDDINAEMGPDGPAPGTQLDLFETKYDVIDQSVHPQFWAYQAGMADGDGSFQLRPKANSIIYVLSLIDKNIIKELSDLYGVNICKPKKKKSHHRQKYIVNLCGGNARHFYNKVYPYLIEERDKVKKQARIVGLKLEDGPTSINYKLCWLAGYFDAEGSVSMQKTYDKKTKNYYFKLRIRFTSTTLKVNRYVRRMLNTIFNINGKKPMANLVKKTKWKNA